MNETIDDWWPCSRRLGRTFIIGAPAFFPTVWNWIKHWYDPVTVSKVFILRASEVSATLAKHIELCDSPRRYGRTLDWEFGQLPELDPEILEAVELKDGATTIPRGPIRWRQSGKGGRVEAHALGTLDGIQRDAVVAEVCEEACRSHTLAKDFVDAGFYYDLTKYIASTEI